VIRQATLPPLAVSSVRGARAFCARVEIEMEVGSAETPGAVSLDWSNDGARTWTTPRLMSAGTPGAFRHRVFTTRLGSFRERSFRITTYGLTRLYAVSADIAPGAS